MNAMTTHDLYDMMSTLRAVRRLRPDPIPADVLERVLQAACWAPTGGNTQPWKVIVVRSPERKAALAALYAPEWAKYAEFARRRAAKAGFGLELIPERVIHVEGGSTNDNPNFQIEAQRGALYLIEKHFPPPIMAALRSLSELICWLASDLDPRVNYRPAWAAVHGIVKRKAYLESPFPLSGRGEVHFGDEGIQK